MTNAKQAAAVLPAPSLEIPWKTVEKVRRYLDAFVLDTKTELATKPYADIRDGYAAGIIATITTETVAKAREATDVPPAPDVDALLAGFNNVNIMVVANGDYTKDGKYACEFSHDDGHEGGEGRTLTEAIADAVSKAREERGGDE